MSFRCHFAFLMLPSGLCRYAPLLFRFLYLLIFFFATFSCRDYFIFAADTSFFFAAAMLLMLFAFDSFTSADVSSFSHA